MDKEEEITSCGDCDECGERLCCNCGRCCHCGTCKCETCHPKEEGPEPVPEINEPINYS